MSDSTAGVEHYRQAKRYEEAADFFHAARNRPQGMPMPSQESRMLDAVQAQYHATMALFHLVLRISQRQGIGIGTEWYRELGNEP